MALDLTPQGLFLEAKKAIDNRDKYLGQEYTNSIERYSGPGYHGGTGADVDFNNHAYKWLSLFLPILASGNPRIRAKTPRHGMAAAICKAIEFGVNRNFELTNAKRTIEQLATDWAFKWCVSLTAPRPVVGMIEREDPPYRPTTVRLSLKDYIWDPVAISHAECRYQGHRIIRDRDSLIREAQERPGRGWNIDAIEMLNVKPDRSGRGKELEETYDRDEVELWEIWVPEAVMDSAKTEKGEKFKPEPSKGYHGTVYTICKDTGEFLRDPRPFWGPRDGPYTYSGYLNVPDHSVPLSPLTATYAQSEIHNSVWQAAVEAMRRYKKGLAVESSAAPDIAEKLVEFEDQSVISLDGIGEGIEKLVRDIEVGGLTTQHLQMLSVLSLNLEQSSGLTEAAMGQASGASTATEASIAQQSSGRRMGYMAEKFITSVVKPIAQKEAWYLTMHPLSRTQLGPEAEGVFVDPATGEPIEYPVLVGGSENADLLEDMDCEVEPISMRSTSELMEAEISAQQDAWIQTFAPLIPQMPWVEWGKVLSKKAEHFRDPSWANIINVNKAAAFGEMMLQIQSMEGVPGGNTDPKPRLAADFSPMKSLKASESPAGFSRNARGQAEKGPRMAGGSKETHSTPSKSNK